MARDLGPQPYVQSLLPITPDGYQRYYQNEFGRVEVSTKSIYDMVPCPATAAPKVPRDGMVRLSRSPWRPVAGTTTDAWVFYDLPSASWKLL